MHEGVLRACELDPVLKSLLLGLKGCDIGHHAVLQMIHIALLIFCELFDESLKGFSSLSLSRCRSSTEELSDTILEDLVDEILVAKGLLLLSVLSNHAHDFRQTVGIVNSHFDACERFSLV